MTDDFAPVTAVAQVMSRFAHPWWIAGGWAIDLFAGRVTREHGDVEVGAFRDTQAALWEHLRRFHLFKAVEHEFVPWPYGEELAAPLFQIQAKDPSLPGGELQVFLDDRLADGRWVCRRNPTITLPPAELTFVCRGVHVLRPEVQLLFKAKHHQLPKNEQDLATSLPLVDEPRRSWLKRSLAATHPGHPWLERL